MTDTTEAPKRGRKPTAAHLVRVRTKARIPQWLQDWLDEQPESDGDLIEAALIKAHKLKPPADQ
jgi:hypothetical protein